MQEIVNTFNTDRRNFPIKIRPSNISMPKSLFEFVEFFWFESWVKTTEFLWNKAFTDIRCSSISNARYVSTVKGGPEMVFLIV